MHTITFPGGIGDYALDNGGRVVAYVEWEGSEPRVVFQKKKGKGYRGIRDLCVSLNSKRLAYVADLDFSSEVMIVDGRESPRYASVQNPVVSSDSKQIGYIGHVLSVRTKDRTSRIGVRLSPLVA